MNDYSLGDVIDDTSSVSKLDQIGIRSSMELLAALPDSDAVKRIAVRVGLSECALAGYRAISDLIRISGIGLETARRLVLDAGIQSIHDLRGIAGDALLAKVKTKIRHPVSRQTVDYWIAQANHLPLMSEPSWIDEELVPLIEKKRQTDRRVFRRIIVPVYLAIAASAFVYSAIIAAAASRNFTHLGLRLDLALGLGWTVFIHHLAADAAILLGLVSLTSLLKVVGRWIRTKLSQPLNQRMTVDERVLCCHWHFVRLSTESGLRLYVLSAAFWGCVGLGAIALLIWGLPILNSSAVVRIFGSMPATAAALAVVGTVSVVVWSAAWLFSFLRRTRRRIQEYSSDSSAIRGLLLVFLRDLLLAVVGVTVFLYGELLVTDASMRVRKHEAQAVTRIYGNAWSSDPGRWDPEAFTTHEDQMLELAADSYLYSSLISPALLRVVTQVFLLITASWVVVFTIRMVLLSSNAIRVFVRLAITIGLSVGLPIALDSALLGDLRLPVTIGVFISASIVLLLELLEHPVVRPRISQDSR